MTQTGDCGEGYNDERIDLHGRMGVVLARDDVARKNLWP